ncbi:MAG: adenosine kinase [Pseudomonadota bacterium]
MSEAELDVIGIGNAIVDVLATVDDAFLQGADISKGTMTLIDEAAAETLYAKMPPGVEASGGSAANTIAALSSLGAHCGFIGKVADDQLGEVFGHDIRAIGVAYSTPADRSGKPTARCLILVTPDAQRSMCTFLGASTDLTTDDLDREAIARAKVTYLEGYLFDPPAARKAFYEAADTAHDAGRAVALSLSDPFCVERYRKDFRHLVKEEVDILFANEAELCSLYEETNFDEALQKVRTFCQTAAITRSEKGSVVVSGDEVHIIDAVPPAQLVDTTGAGDAYAAGFLYGYARQLGLVESGRLGSLAASEVISHMGARPSVPLDRLAKEAGLL